MNLGPKYLQGCIVAFILLSLLGLILEGTYFRSEENNLISELTKWTLGSFSWWAIPVVFASVLWNLPDLLSFDYSFFTSLGPAGALIRLVLGASISFAIIWAFMSMLLPVGINALASVAGGAISLFRRF